MRRLDVGGFGILGLATLQMRPHIVLGGGTTSVNSEPSTIPRPKATGCRIWRRLEVGGFGVNGAASSLPGPRSALTAARRRRIGRPRQGLASNRPGIGVGGGSESAGSTPTG